MFEATKREWSEIYAFFHLLGEGKTYMGDGNLKGEECYWPIAMIQREEHDGTRNYYIEEDWIRIETEQNTERFPREDFKEAANLILLLIKGTRTENVVCPEGLEAFLDAINIYNLEAQTEDRTDLKVAFWHPQAPLVGLSVWSRLSGIPPLLNGGRTANLKLELTGIKFAVPTINKINASPESVNEVAERMMLIERLGGVLKYADVADRVFRCNLLMIDLHFPRMLTEMVRTMHLDSITSIRDLTQVVERSNPLKIKEELITKHKFYEFKIRQFLMALALGMRPAKIYRGMDSAIEGFLLINSDGQVSCYHKSRKQVLEDFLFNNTRMEKSDLNKDKYGFLERENGTYYFKLNVKIGLIKQRSNENK